MIFSTATRWSWSVNPEKTSKMLTNFCPSRDRERARLLRRTVVRFSLFESDLTYIYSWFWIFLIFESFNIFILSFKGHNHYNTYKAPTWNCCQFLFHENYLNAGISLTMPSCIALTCSNQKMSFGKNRHFTVFPNWFPANQLFKD